MDRWRIACREINQGPLPLREAVELLQTLANAVAFAHRNNVIHRDLKPSNILLTAEKIPKIADFGLAKLLDGDNELTVSEMVLGTPSYMAPEQAAGRRRDIGPLTDVYSLGAILYEAITGQAPFHGENKIETMRMVREMDLVPPRKIRPDIPRNLEEIVVKCLEKLPARPGLFRRPGAGGRPYSVVGGKTRYQHTPGWFSRLGRQLQKNAKVILMVVVLLASVVGIAIAVRKPEERSDASDQLPHEFKYELVEGQPTVLIGATGNPKVFKWRMQRQDRCRTGRHIQEFPRPGHLPVGAPCRSGIRAFPV